MPHAEGIYYEVCGWEGGDTVLMSAGLGGSGEYWRPQVEALSDQYQVILYDHRGTARSDRTLSPSLTLEHMADDAIAVLDELGIERAHLVGHALGGTIGLQLALKAPKRLKSIVAVNAWGKLEPHTRRCFDARLALLRNSGIDAFVQATPLFLYPAVWSSDHPERLAEEAAHQLKAFPGMENTLARIAALFDFDHYMLHEIGVSTLAIAALDDLLVPYTASMKLAGDLPHGQYSLVSSGGHACTVTQSAEFNSKLLAWLANEPLPEWR